MKTPDFKSEKCTGVMYIHSPSWRWQFDIILVQIVPHCDCDINVDFVPRFFQWSSVFTGDVHEYSDYLFSSFISSEKKEKMSMWDLDRSALSRFQIGSDRDRESDRGSCFSTDRSIQFSIFWFAEEYPHRRCSQLTRCTLKYNPKSFGRWQLQSNITALQKVQVLPLKG